MPKRKAPTTVLDLLKKRVKELERQRNEWFSYAMNLAGESAHQGKASKRNDEDYKTDLRFANEMRMLKKK
jgi:hypothetical protein